jgi:curved DNA-binding protein CbpA
LSILGLQADASKEAIKQAFRKLVKQHHPDLGGSADAFRRVNDAYQLLMA